MSIKKIAMGLLVGGLFILNGCGGGGGNSLPTKPSSSEMQKLSDSNAENAGAGAVASIISSSNLSNNPIPGADLKIHNKLTKMAKLSIKKSYKTVDLDVCDSGSAKYDGGETSGTVTYKNCKISDTVFNGKIKVDATIVDDELKNVTAIYENFTVKNDSLKMSIEIKYAKVFVDNDSNTESISKLYATFEIDKKIQKYLNYNITLKEKHPKTTVTAKGYVKPYCLDGYVYLETMPKIEDEYDSEADKDSIKGKIKVESNSKTVTVEFNNDTVKITKPSGESEIMSLEEFDEKIKEKCGKN